MTVLKFGKVESAAVLDPRDPMPSAREFVADCFTDTRGRLLHRHRNAFYFYNGAFYRMADDEEIRAAAWSFLESAQVVGKKGELEPFRPTRARVSDVFDALPAVCALDPTVAAPAWLNGENGEDDRPPAVEFMAVSNGLLHMPTGTLYDPTPLFFGLNAWEVEFNPDAPEPMRWLRFLDDLFGADREAIETLQDWSGYALTTDTRQQKILLVVGPKRSGKGTVARVITKLLGASSVTAPTLAGLSSNFGLEPLIGKPLAVISDARLGSRSDQAAISERLLSISGEDSLTIDRKFRPAWTGQLCARFMLLTNELPRITDASGALTSRFIVLVLENSFYGREDPGLTDQLLTELPGILNWSLDGYRRLQARGYFIQPASAMETIEALETLASPITAFVRENCRLEPGLRTSPSVLYSAWKLWCEINGRREPGTIQSFGRDLRAAFPPIQSRQHRDSENMGKPLRMYEGIGVL